MPPRKRPLHNMVPVLITKGSQHIVHGWPFGESLASPRLHTKGGKLVEHQKAWPKPSIDVLNKAGYTVKTGGSAPVSGVALEIGKWLADMP